MRKQMSHSAFSATSVTLEIWQNGAKVKYCNFALYNGIVDTKTSIIQTGPNILRGFKNLSFFYKKCAATNHI